MPRILWNEPRNDDLNLTPSSNSRISGLAYSWRIYRQCCCVYGWYPLIVSLLVTVGCFLSLYSATGCDFIRVDIDFTPENRAWNSSKAELGLFLYQSGKEDANKYVSFFGFDGCRFYTEEFLDEFVDGDSFSISRIVAYVTIGSSIFVMITSWLFVLSPLPPFFWPVFLLPALVTSTLAQGLSIFLAYDTAICRKEIWKPPGIDSDLRIAECSLGYTGFYGIASAILFLSVLLLVCIKEPRRRHLVPNYGLDLENANPRKAVSSFDSGNEQVLYNYPAIPPIELEFYTNNDEDGESDFTLTSREYDSGYETNEILDDYDDLVSQQKNMCHGDDDGKYDFRKPPATNVTIIRNRLDGKVSLSRIETVQRMEKNTIDENDDNSTEIMIDQLLTELDKSFNIDEGYRNKYATCD